MFNFNVTRLKEGMKRYVLCESIPSFFVSSVYFVVKLKLEPGSADKSPFEACSIAGLDLTPLSYERGSARSGAAVAATTESF
jgi:hypothetical protein